MRRGPADMTVVCVTSSKEEASPFSLGLTTCGEVMVRFVYFSGVHSLRWGG